MDKETNVQLMAKNYKLSFITTIRVEEDLKLVKKMNTLFNKLEKTGKDQYVHEIVNILIILNNSIHIDRIISVFYDVVDLKFHNDMEQLIFDTVQKS